VTDDVDPVSFEVEIPGALDGERVDRVVAMLTGLSRAEAAAVVDAGSVLLDGLVVDAGKRRVAAGQLLGVTGALPSGPEPPTADPSVVVPVVYEDPDVVVVDKPEGLVVHPGPGNPTGTLVHGLLARYPDIAAVGDPMRPGIVHRLDKGTSGLLVVARSETAYESLVAQLAARAVTRGYVALVWGTPASPSGLVDAPIGRSPRDPLRMAVVADGKPARTRYETVATYRDPVEVARLTCTLETGRTHQTRVHLQALGHPVVGDAWYGGARPGLDLSRPFLHAAHLAFAHPVSGDGRSFRSELPADLLAVLERLS
jgi:23S rRNA pseudouridine1911/1915/1917 synthase